MRKERIAEREARHGIRTATRSSRRESERDRREAGRRRPAPSIDGDGGRSLYPVRGRREGCPVVERPSRKGTRKGDRTVIPTTDRERRDAGRKVLQVVEGGPGVRSRDDRAGEQSGSRRAGKARASRRRALALLALFLALALAAAVLYRPVARYLESRGELSRTETRLAEEKALTEELEERRARALSDKYVEGEARRMGYVKPGEIPLIVLDDKDTSTTDEASQEP